MLFDTDRSYKSVRNSQHAFNLSVENVNALQFSLVPTYSL